MKKQLLLIGLVLAMVSVLAFTTGALAPNPVAAAPGGGGPGGGGGGGDDVIPDYGDLIILYRDADGVPIPSDPVEVLDPETGETVAGGLCWQPIAFNVDDEAACPAACVVDTDPATVDVDQYTCGVAAGCSGCTQEVDFGRINEARSSDLVFESQLEDVVINLATADCRTLDPAGRMVASRAGDDGVVSRTIDSPLQNLAIYRQLMLTADIGAPLPEGVTTLDTAARGLGVASDKGGEVNVDMVAYVNQIMGLDDVPTILDPKLCETYREEVMGTIEKVEKCFLDYGAYNYARGTSTDPGKFRGLPSPAYIPSAVPTEGTFEYLSVVTPETSPPTFEISQGPITTAVFEDETGFTGGNIGGFAQLADDTRAVINFMHDWPIPDADVYGTPVPCAANPNLVAYDVGFSDVSGLQVPRQMIDGSEGREFTVTVANASGSADPATGTVTVFASLDEAIYRVDEVQEIFNDATDGTFTLSFDGEVTVPIDFDAAAADVDTALEALANINTVLVTGEGTEISPWVIVFQDPGAQDVAEIIATDNLDPGASTTIATSIEGSTGDNILGFPRYFAFEDLVPGQSAGWTESFTTEFGERTTIYWMAVAVAPHEVNLSNNTVYATTNVRTTGGGGGGG